MRWKNRPLVVSTSRSWYVLITSVWFITANCFEIVLFADKIPHKLECMQGAVKPGRTGTEAAEKTADATSQQKHERPVSPSLSDFVVVPDSFSFDSSGTSLLVSHYVFVYILLFILKYVVQNVVKKFTVIKIAISDWIVVAWQNFYNYFWVFALSL